MSERDSQETESSFPVELTKDLLESMDGSSITSKETFLYDTEAPKFLDIVDDDVDRSNLIHINANAGYVSQFYRDGLPDDEAFTERQAVQNLREFLESVVNIPQSDTVDTHDAFVREYAQQMLGQLSYIGETELLEGIEAMTAHWLEYINAGLDLYVYCPTGNNPGYRSQFYVTLRALESFTSQTENATELRPHIHVTEHASELKAALAARPDDEEADYRIVFADDTAITGSQLRTLFYSLGDISQEQAAHFEAHYITASDMDITVDTANGEQVVHRVAHYKAGNGKVAPLITQSHSSTDNTYEIAMLGMQDLLRKHAEAYQKPLPIFIRRPYDMEAGPDRDEQGALVKHFDDETLMPRWQALLARYGLHQSRQ